MPCIELSQGPMTCSTWDFRGSGPGEAFRDLEATLAPILKASEIAHDKNLYRQ